MPNHDAASQSLIFLHEMFHVTYLLGLDVEIVLDIAMKTFEAHTLTDPVSYRMRIPSVPAGKLQPLYSNNNYIGLVVEYVMPSLGCFQASIERQGTLKQRKT